MLMFRCHGCTGISLQEDIREDLPLFTERAWSDKESMVIYG